MPNQDLVNQMALLNVAKILDNADAPLMGFINVEEKRLYFTFNGVKMAVILNPN